MKPPPFITRNQRNQIMAKNNEKGGAHKASIDDTTKLVIRDLIREEFASPPAVLHERIENEVRDRIRRQEKYYYGFIILFLASVALFYTVELIKIPKVVDEALKSDSSKIAQDKLTAILTNAQAMEARLNSYDLQTKFTAALVKTNLSLYLYDSKTLADDVNRQIGAIPILIDTNVVTPYSRRLAEISKQDNFITIEDISRLFVREIITSLEDKTVMVLTHEPISQSVKIYAFQTPGGAVMRFFPLENFGYCEGHSLHFTNVTPALTSQVLDRVATGGVVVEYFRKSPR